jgi:predicted enzyme related to lactoylglutathione lyase
MGDPTRQTGRFVWRELLTPDVEVAEAFYEGLFGWRYEPMDLGAGPPYPTIVVGGAPVGGLSRMTPGAHSPASWSSYVSVESIEGSLSQARARGGSVAMGPIDVPGEGRLAMVTDPWGATLAIFHAAERDAPLPDSPPEGAFCWETLVTPEPAAAIDFYAHLIGWTTRPSGGAVPILMAGRVQVADVQQASPGRPAAWITYVRVGALEAVRDRVARLGGAVRVPEVRIPEVGRVAAISDPQDASLALFEPAAREPR